MEAYYPEKIQGKKQASTAYYENKNSLGSKFVRKFKSGVEHIQNSDVGKVASYIQDSRFGRAAQKTGKFLFYDVPKLAVYDIPNAVIRDNLRIPDNVSTKDGLKGIAKEVYYSTKNLPKNLKDPVWRHFTWEFHKYDLIPIVISAGIAGVGVVNAIYNSNLSSIANSKPHGMDKTIGEFWAQHKMPVQQLSNGTAEIVNLIQPSITIKPDPLGMPTVPRFTTRDMYPIEETITNLWKNGEYTGLKEFASAAVIEAAHVGTRYAVGKHAEKKLQNK